VARKNAKTHGVQKKIEFKKSDLLKNVLHKPITGIVANLPYIANGDKFVDKEVRKHEPKIALFSGRTGLELFEKLFNQIVALRSFDCAQDRQAQGDNLQWLVCEVGAGQKSAINTLIKKHFVNARVMWKNDLAGIPRVFTVLF
jgi:release factor glutamine methyltransferase